MIIVGKAHLGQLEIRAYTEKRSRPNRWSQRPWSYHSFQYFQRLNDGRIDREAHGKGRFGTRLEARHVLTRHQLTESTIWGVEYSNKAYQYVHPAKRVQKAAEDDWLIFDTKLSKWAVIVAKFISIMLNPSV